MDKLSQTIECVSIGKCKISQLLFADDLVLLASSESGLRHASNSVQNEIFAKNQRCCNV